MVVPALHLRWRPSSPIVNSHVPTLDVLNQKTNGKTNRRIARTANNDQAEGLLPLVVAACSSYWAGRERYSWRLTFDMRGDRQQAKLDVGRPLDGGVRPGDRVTTA